VKRAGCALLWISILIAAGSADALETARFGFEYNEAGSHPKHELLLSKLANITDRGEINVNGISWQVMQTGPNEPINFTMTDSIVDLFGRHGFSLAWYMNPNAGWAFPNKPECCVPICGNCAPESEFEHYWTDYVKAVVERYDGDGLDDMPGLLQPVRHYILPGEIRYGSEGQGDALWGPFWLDTIDKLLYVHRLTYRAVYEADPTGNSKVVSSGALLFDLFADFPDWPEVDPIDPNSLIQKRLNGENYRGSFYTAGWDSLKKMLISFSDDSDGIECDLIGWHPHFSWRVIDQEFAFVRRYAGDMPIYVDDMWTNILVAGYFRPYLGKIPGGAQFNAPANIFAGTEWVSRINGDFPNSLFTSINPYDELNQKLSDGDQAVIDWYYATGARRLVKSFVSAFGEGAIFASFSGTNDISRETPVWGILIGRGTALGWINLTGTREEDYFEKPQYHTMKLLVEKIHDFTRADEIAVSDDPRTRVYEFHRPRGPVYVLWSETGAAPADLDYRNPTGETVTLKLRNNADRLLLTHIVTDTLNTEPEQKTIAAQDGFVTFQLGYEPFFLEGDFLESVREGEPGSPSSFALERNYPNPFNPATTIEYSLPRVTRVEIKIFDMLGREVRRLVAGERTAGFHRVLWDGTDDDGNRLSSGVYFYRMTADGHFAVRKLLLLR
jgi:hypothetical protein